MRQSVLLITFTVLVITHTLRFRADAAPAAPLIKHLSSIIKWTRSSSKISQSEGNAIQFESGYLVETVVEGNELGGFPYSISVSEDGELFAVDGDNSNIVKITPPLSHYSRARLVAGSFQGYTGHVDGKPSEACFNKPKGVTMDDKGNVYVADTLNLAIRKIGDSGVTTIAGGKSNVAGFRDGPSEDAKFSTDFDVVYVRSTCSLLVVDRGNAALRQISLNQDDCDYQNNSISLEDILMVIGAIFIGYISCMLHQGFGSSSISKQQPLESEFQHHTAESVKDEPVAGWPSFGQLVTDLLKLALEASTNIFLSLLPAYFKPGNSKNALTPLKHSLKMPEDEPQLSSVHKQRVHAPITETRQAPFPIINDSNKTQKLKSSSFKDASKRSSKRQDYAEFYGSGEVLPAARSKSQKERSRHRHRDKSGEVVFGAVGSEPKPVEIKPVNYDDPKFNLYNIKNNRYGSDDSFRF